MVAIALHEVRGTLAPYWVHTFSSSSRHADYTRPMADPGGENQIIMFKSCYPNSHLGKNPFEGRIVR